MSAEPQGKGTTPPPASVAAETSKAGNEDLTPSVVASSGVKVDTIQVTIGRRFLDLFSANLYRSPNKAFEELISNAWDAGATAVHIVIQDNLEADDATVWVLDNGHSMDVEGLRALWTVAESPKRKGPALAGRSPIGKFGIGKLATYLLANEVSYICRAGDGIVRAVTMDYRHIAGFGDDPMKMADIPLDVRVLDAATLQQILDKLPEGARVKTLLAQQIPSGDYDFTDEFGGDNPPTAKKSETWTLCVLTSLKPPGRRMQIGHIKRMLRAALPLGSSMSIVFNGDSLPSSKVDEDVQQQWVLGIDPLPFTELLLNDDETKANVMTHSSPQPHLTIEGIDEGITGTIRLFANRISGVKSDEHGASNGFHINVLGRVINEEDPYFGLENLNHTAWAKFRAAVRADGLDGVIAVNRDTVRDDASVTIFRAFLLRLFNMARQVEDSLKRETWKNAGELLERSWGTVPLEPLHRVLRTHAEASTMEQLPTFIDVGELPSEQLEEQLEESKPADMVSEVVFDDAAEPDAPLVRYDVATRRVLVNQNHPFSREHSATAEEQVLLRDASLAGLLTDAFMADRGVDPTTLDEILEFRDQVLRRIALVRRRSGAEIARLLLLAGTWRGMETIVGDALEYLGFSVERLGGSNEPEGVVTAAVTATKKDTSQAYKFTFDTKFSASGKAQTGNVHMAGLKRHRVAKGADHTLVVAPSFQSGALEVEASDQDVTPMMSRDLGALVLFAAANGPIDLKGFRTVFELHSPDAVSNWVKKLTEETQKQAPFSLHEFCEAIAAIGFDGNSLSASVIADRIKLMFKKKPTKEQVRRVAAGLQVLVPHLIQVSGSDTIFLSTTPTKLRDAVVQQVKNIPSNYQFNFKELAQGSA